MARLAISLLGPLEVRLDGRAITALAYDKVWALLAYLAVEADRPHRRDALIGLLWPDQADHAARTNLRQALTQLRHAIGDHTAQPPFLLIARETIQFNRESDHDLDVVGLTALLDACETHPHRHADTCTTCVRRRAEAGTLYRGSFLAEFFLEDAAAFEEWSLLKREDLHHRALHALAHLATYYGRRGAYEDVRGYAQRQLELDPWNEAAHRQVMRAFALTGQRSAALAQYERCRRVLAEELGVAPEAETTALYVRLQRGEAVAAERMRPPATNLPAHTPPTLFIGREVELMHIAQRLEHRDCRLLTLVGLGGIGKTRLALQAAQEQLTSFSDGVYFVPLARLSSAEFLVPAIADALAFVFHGSQDLKTQLMAYLREKHMLLVLDNFEHLLDGTDVLSEIVQCAAGVTLLVTSRERLNLRVEWIMDIAGMPVPRGADSEAVATSSAVQLFVQTASQVQAGFALSPETVPSVVRICQMVDGMPLAIELAASWAWAQLCADIARELEHSLDHLATTMRDVPARHRSMRGVFDHSWNLLSADEQRAMAALSVFRGGFASEAAEQVAEAPLQLLTGLVGKSLLRRDQAGRYDLHELVRQYAGEKLLEAGQAERIRNRHFLYFLGLAQEAEPKLYGPEQVVWFNRLEIEHNNLRAALTWSRTTAEGSVSMLQLAGSLWWFWLVRDYLSEGRAWLGEALAEQSTAARRAPALLGAGTLASFQHDLVQARKYAEQSLTLFQELEDRRGIALALHRLGQVCAEQGNLTRAVLLGEQALALFREIGDSWGIPFALGSLAQVAQQQADDERAAALYQEGLMLARQQGDTRGIAAFLGFLGRLAYKRSDDDQAARWYQESLTLFSELGDRGWVAGLLSDLGDVAQHQADHHAARRFYAESLALCRELGEHRGIVLCLARLARLASLTEQQECAARLLGAVEVLSEATNLRMDYIVCAEYDRALAFARAQLDEATFAAWWAEGRALSLEQAVAVALHDEEPSYRGDA